VFVEITDIIDESPRVKRFILSTLDGSNIEFFPGQFVTIYNRNWPEFSNTRSYSIASSDTCSNSIELCIALNENGLFTPWLFQLNKGEQLEISEPQGQFVYKQEYAPFSSVFICTGTGVAPFLSMIQSALNIGQSSVYLVFGNRKFDDILYREHFESLSAEYPNFHFVPVLSQENAYVNNGYVHAYYASILRDIGGDARIFVCGWKNMCIETRDKLKQMGYNRKQYFFEQYN
jgi:ferredoxin-NADP reductase